MLGETGPFVVAVGRHRRWTRLCALGPSVRFALAKKYSRATTGAQLTRIDNPRAFPNREIPARKE